MKMASASMLAAPIFSGLMLLLAGTRTAVAQTGTIYVPFEDVEFAVDRYDDNGDVRYEVTFTDFEFESNYDFDGDGFVTFLQADNERYRFLYRANGRLRLVRLLSSRRMLGEEAIEVADVAGGGDKALVGKKSIFGAMGVEEQTTPAVDGGGGRRRLLECDECRQTWDTVCDNGVATVCDLVEYGDPFLGAGDVSVSVFCENFGQLCDENTSDDVCLQECGGGDDEECLAPLTILLEYEYVGEGNGDSEGNSLDLYVIEPGGTVAYWDNSVTDLGYMSSGDYYIKYTIFDGLDENAALGKFSAFGEWWQGPGPISWTLTATTGGGDVLYVEQGEILGGDCGSTSTGLVIESLDEYVDNGCDTGE